ncbi:MAG: DUF364 domain-containing protein [Chloroflexi bacterium]|nr:DUF364 domain-containing protein [Chloroflexota bacterium]
MPIIEDLLASLREDRPVQDVCIGAFWTAVVSSRCGLASTLRDDDHCHRGPVREAGHLLERSALELSTMVRSNSLLEASIGMAAINSLLEVDENLCIELNAEELIRERGTGKQVAIVGHFPFTPRIRDWARQLWVLELKPRGDELPAEQAPAVLPQADVVAITGTSLINHTFDKLMALCRPDAFVVVLGASTPLSPLLFEYGVHAIAGTVVMDNQAVLRCVSQGATFPQLAGVRLLTMLKGKTEGTRSCTRERSIRGEE